MTEDRRPEDSTTPESTAPEGSATPEGSTPESSTTPIGETPVQAAAPTEAAAAPPPLAPYVNTGAAEPHAPLGNQAAGAAGAYTPPPVPPPAVQQPAVAWAAPPPAAAPVQGRRTILAALAGIVALVGGILWALLGLGFALIGGSFFASLGDFADFSSIPELQGADPGAVLGGVAAFFGIIIVVLGLLYVFAGIGILRSSNWARVLGLVLGIIGGLLWLSSLTGAGTGETDGTAFALVHVIANAFIVVVLLLFWKTKPATA